MAFLSKDYGTLIFGLAQIQVMSLPNFMQFLGIPKLVILE